MKIVFFFNAHKPLGKLTKYFTGCYAYHVGFWDPETDTVWDMYLLRRSYKLKHRYPQSMIVDSEEGLDMYIAGNIPIIYSFDAPTWMTPEFLERRRMDDEDVYSALDYLLFSCRPLYHLFGKSTPNAGGKICSEMVYEDLMSAAPHGSTYPLQMKFGEVPSPCDLYKRLLITS